MAHTKSAGAPVSSPVQPRAERNREFSSPPRSRLRAIDVEIVVAEHLMDLAAFLVQPHHHGLPWPK